LPDHFCSPNHLCQLPDIHDEFGELLSLRNNKKRQTAMFKRSKVRQAGLIVFATTLLLILPNLTRLFG
jgi:hypothetical protein